MESVHFQCGTRYKGAAVMVDLPGYYPEGDGDGVHVGGDMTAVDVALQRLEQGSTASPARTSTSDQRSSNGCESARRAVARSGPRPQSRTCSTRPAADEAGPRDVSSTLAPPGARALSTSLTHPVCRGHIQQREQCGLGPALLLHSARRAGDECVRQPFEPQYKRPVPTPNLRAAHA